MSILSSFRHALVALALTFSAPALAQNLTFPGDFFVDRISGSACSRFYSPGRLSSDLSYISGIKQARLNSTNSVTIDHDQLSKRWTRLLEVSMGVAARSDAAAARRIIATMTDIAAANALLDAPSLTIAKKTKCWDGGSGKSICLMHVVSHTGYTAIAMLYSAIMLEEYIAPDQRKVLDAYFKRMNGKFLAPIAKEFAKGRGLYEFTDNGLGVLAYARWTRNERMAARELKARKSAFARKIAPDGMIKENSYRGYRGYWYHTLGAESALGYALVARSFGHDFFNDRKIGPRLRALAIQTVNGGANYNAFLQESLKGGSDNKIRDKNLEIPHMHQFAVNLPLIVRQEYGWPVQTARGYRSKGSSETISRLIGFNADCYYSSR